MPVAKVYVPEGLLTPDQRREIIKGIHDVIVSVEQRAPDALTYVLIKRHCLWAADLMMRACLNEASTTARLEGGR
jgi:hypothetical protein